MGVLISGGTKVQLGEGMASAKAQRRHSAQAASGLACVGSGACSPCVCPPPSYLGAVRAKHARTHAHTHTLLLSISLGDLSSVHSFASNIRGS